MNLLFDLTGQRQSNLEGNSPCDVALLTDTPPIPSSIT
jgi:hypothetical protein